MNKYFETPPPHQLWANLYQQSSYFKIPPPSPTCQELVHIEQPRHKTTLIKRDAQIFYRCHSAA